jgi:Flp pilus assembly pilin Flp
MESARPPRGGPRRHSDRYIIIVEERKHMPNMKKRKGSVFIEYALLIGAVTLIAILAFSVLGHKTNDIVATGAALLPGAHAEDDLTFVSGSLVEFTSNNGDAEIDTSNIGNADSNRLGDSIGVNLNGIVK